MTAPTLDNSTAVAALGPWRCSAGTNQALIANMKKAGLVQSRQVEAALLAIDRGNYVPHRPYDDAPQQIGYKATISAPHMHASCLEKLHAVLANTDGDPPRILDVGAGSG